MDNTVKSKMETSLLPFQLENSVRGSWEEKCLVAKVAACLAYSSSLAWSMLLLASRSSRPSSGR